MASTTKLDTAASDALREAAQPLVGGERDHDGLMAFIGDALAHTVLPGLVVAYLRGWNLFAGAILAGLATALGIGVRTLGMKLKRWKEDGEPVDQHA